MEVITPSLEFLSRGVGYLVAYNILTQANHAAFPTPPLPPPSLKYELEALRKDSLNLLDSCL